MDPRASVWLASISLLSACGDGNPGAGSGSAKSDGPPQPEGTYSLDDHRSNASACDESGLSKIASKSSHFVVARGPANTWVVLGCSGIESCKQTRAAVEKGESISGHKYAKFDKATGTKLEGSSKDAIGNYQAGQCTGLKRITHTLELSGTSATLESRTEVYAPFQAPLVSDCTSVDAEKKTVSTTCAALDRLAATRVAD